MDCLDPQLLTTHASALWHHMWFQAVEACQSDTRDAITAEEAATYDMSADEVDEYNTWQAERDIPAEKARHQAAFDAFRFVYSLMGFNVPDAEAVGRIATFETFQAEGHCT